VNFQGNRGSIKYETKECKNSCSDFVKTQADVKSNGEVMVNYYQTDLDY
jgi:hypothetical protein